MFKKALAYTDSTFVLLGAFIGVVILSGLFFVYATSGDAKTETISDTTPGDVLLDTDIIPANFVRRYDGVVIPEQESPTKLFAVMIENSRDAWPLSGLSQARIVFEAQVEGNIPRFMAVFDDTQQLDRIGPVRSARPYFVDWALGLNAMYVHVGGSPQALATLQSKSIKSINEFYNGSFFVRDQKRYAPHNVYTSIDQLKAMWESKTYANLTEQPVAFIYTNKAVPDDQRPTTQVIEIPFSQADQYTAVWAYQQSSNDYRRSQGSNVQTDQSGDFVVAKNIVVIKTPVSIIDEIGRKSIKTIGEGDALLINNGQSREVSWKKSAQKSSLELVDDQQQPVSLLAGTTWVEVVPTNTEVILK